MADPKLCSIPDCGKPTKGRGWCSAHYDRWRHHGDPTGGRVTITARGEAQRYFRAVVIPYVGDECLIWPFNRGSNGYALMKSAGRYRVVSNLVCREVNGPPPTLEHGAAHSCGKGHDGCVASSHLSWKTQTENMADRARHGTETRGEKHGRSKLTEGDVAEIRRLRGSEPQKSLATRFNVSANHIGKIQRGVFW